MFRYPAQHDYNNNLAAINVFIGDDMSLMHAILGFLNRSPQTGYALKNERFDQSVAHFWPADQTQIYKTLDKLVDQNFATSAIEVQTDRPNRKVYSISKGGKQELKRWVGEDHDLMVYRDPLLVQLFFGDCVDSEDMVAVLQAAKKKQQESLEALRSIGLPPASKCAEKELLFARLTLDLGLQSKQAYIDWLNQSIAHIGKHSTATRSGKK